MHLPSVLWSEALGLWEVEQPSKSTWKVLTNRQSVDWMADVQYQRAYHIYTAGSFVEDHEMRHS